MTTSDPAYILFPGDAPIPKEPPEWHVAQRSEAEARLMRKAPTAPDPAAAALFPSDAPKTAAPIDKDASVEDKLFPDEKKVEFDDKVARSFFNGFAMSAAADGDADRARALEAAGEAIVADAIKAGTNAADLSDALNIVKDRQGDFAPSEEKMATDFASSMESLQAEYGETFQSELGAAHAMLRDIELIAPGTMASLDRTGAGNDMKLIRIAIREAKRRGYGGAR